MTSKGWEQQAPFEVLGVSPAASPEEIATAYKVLAQIFHPDRFHDAPDPVRLEAEARMKALNNAYEAARAGSLGHRPPTGGRHARPSPGWGSPAPGARRWAGVSWEEASRARAAESAKANEARLARQRAATNGEAIARDRAGQPFRHSVLNGLGLARLTNNIVCQGCESVQWLPADWRQRLNDCAFFCSVCDRPILARARADGTVKAGPAGTANNRDNRDNRKNGASPASPYGPYSLGPPAGPGTA